MKKTMKLWMLALPMLLGLASCNDTIDNPVSPDQPSDNPATQETYQNQALMDLTVKPGDSFYNYALGSWLKKHKEEDQGTTLNAENKLSEAVMTAFAESSDPTVQKLITIIRKNAKADYQAAYAAIEAEAIRKIEPQLTELFRKGLSAAEGETVATADDVIRMMASLIKKGYAPLLSCIGYMDEGYYKVGVSAGDISNDMKENLAKGDTETALTCAKAVVRFMLDGILPEGQKADDKTVEVVAAKMMEIDKAMLAADNDEYSGDLDKRAKARVSPKMDLSEWRLRTRAAEGADPVALLGLTKENSVIDPNAIKAVENLLNAENPDNLITYLMYHLTGENIGLALRGYLNYGNSELDKAGIDIATLIQFTDEQLLKQVYTKLTTQAPELISRADYDYFTAHSSEYDAEGCREMMEQMRKVMDERISNLPWMGDATKSEARKKLAAMEFNIGLPPVKPGEDLQLVFATADDESVVSAVQQLRQQRYEVYMKLANNHTPIAGHGWDYLVQYKPLSTSNATYVTNMNQLIIYPAFVRNTLFPKDNELMRYATAMVFGHEITHGFDTNGAKCDATGTQKNWWAAADSIAFKELGDKMVTRYNELYQYGTVHADGKKTLDENIADLGGIRIAFELYKQQLAARGTDAAETDHLLREFFLHIALLWQADDSDDELQNQLEADEHSANRTRVEGVTRLMDEWYELFSVTGGKNYLKPEDRVTIW